MPVLALWMGKIRTEGDAGAVDEDVFFPAKVTGRASDGQFELKWLDGGNRRSRQKWRPSWRCHGERANHGLVPLHAAQPPPPRRHRATTQPPTSTSTNLWLHFSPHRRALPCDGAGTSTLRQPHR